MNCKEQLFFFFNLFFRERKRAWAEGGPKGEGEERNKQTPPCWEEELTQDSIPEPWDDDLSLVRCLIKWATLAPQEQFLKITEWKVRTEDLELSFSSTTSFNSNEKPKPKPMLALSQVNTELHGVGKNFVMCKVLCKYSIFTPIQALHSSEVLLHPNMHSALGPLLKLYCFPELFHLH